MKQITTTKATILFVEVPEDAASIQVFSQCLWLNTTTLINSFIQRIELPDGTWQFITLLKDAREETAMTLVDKIEDTFNPWMNYEKSIYQLETALESLHSLATSLGVKGNCAVLVRGGG